MQSFRLLLQVSLCVAAGWFLHTPAHAHPKAPAAAGNAETLGSQLGTGVEACPTLPQVQRPLAFGAGETLEFDLDALGAQAGKMTMRVLPVVDGQLPVKVTAKTNTFFSKVRRVSGEATSYMDPKTLRPRRYVEDAVENEIPKFVEVRFAAKDKPVAVDYRIGKRTGQRMLKGGKDVLDTAGAIYLMRQLPMEAGRPLCFDVYGIRTLWRLTGKVVGKEKVSLPVGEFEAWHLEGVAVRHDAPNHKREVHVWISNDERRLPLAAVGVIDLGAVRATLTAYNRPGDTKARAQGKESLKW